MESFKNLTLPFAIAGAVCDAFRLPTLSAGPADGEAAGFRRRAGRADTRRFEPGRLRSLDEQR